MDKAPHGGGDKDREDDLKMGNSGKAYDRALAQEQ
jgi:hypothetical protein